MDREKAKPILGIDSKIVYSRQVGKVANTKNLLFVAVPVRLLPLFYAEDPHLDNTNFEHQRAKRV